MGKLLFSTDTDSGTVTVLDLEVKEMPRIAEIPIGNGPRGPVKFTKTGRGFVANHAGNTLSEIDAYSLRELTRITVGIAPIGCAVVPGDRYVMTSITGDNTIAIVDIEQRKVVHYCVVGREPRHMAITPDGKFAYVAVSGGDYIGKISISALTENRDADISSVREVGRIFLGKGTLPYSISISPNGKRALAANNQSSYVSLIDLKDDKVIQEIEVGSKGARGSVFSDENTKVFVTIEDTSEILAIDVESGEIEKRMPAGPGPRGILLDLDTNRLFASAFSRTGGITSSLREGGFRPNSVSVLSIGAIDNFRALAVSDIGIEELSVGAGPCSVSIYNR